MKNRNLRVYERASLYPQSIAYYFEMFYFLTSEYPYLAKFWEVVASIRGYFYWARDTDYLEKAARKWFNNWLADPQERKRIYSLFFRDKQDLHKVVVPLGGKDLARLGNKELFKVYQTVIDFALKHICYAEYTVDLFDDYFAKFFIEHLRKNKAALSGDDLNSCIQPATISANADYRRKIIKLSFAKKLPKHKISGLVKQYSWIRMSWDGANELEIKDILADISELRKTSREQLLLELKNIETLPETVRQKRNSLIVKLGIETKLVLPFFELLDNFGLFHDYRKEIQMRSNQIIFRVLREIPKRFGLSFEDLMWYFNDEIKNLLLKNVMVPSEIIAERKEGLVFHIHKNKIKKYFGRKAVKKLEELVLSAMRADDTKEIRGVPASIGKTSGTVFVCKDAGVANISMPKGAILVTSMTTIDFIPSMRRAKAVVTDDGGATCHAAVVSREFGIPCVVGAKVATQLLKTGDVVEVDGRKGIVKIILRREN